MTYLKPEVLETLKQIADAKDRSVSNLAARILTDWVRNYEVTGGKNDEADID